MYSQQPDLPLHITRITFKNEEGDVQGGLTREFFTAFCADSFQEYFSDNEVVAPNILLHRCRNESIKYVALGRILSHTAALMRTIPCRLSLSSYICVIFVDEECILKDFLNYLTINAKVLLQTALSHFETSGSQYDKLQAFFAIIMIYLSV